MAAGRLRRISKAFAVVLISATAYLPVNGASTAPDDGARASPALQVPLLRDGDIVLRRGLDLMSRLVLTQGDAARFSHVGLVVLQRNIPYVIHAMPAENGRIGGAVLESFAQFVSPSEAAEVAIYRGADLTEIQGAIVRQTAFSQLGLPFDERFQLSNIKKVYCTGLVLRSYAAAGLALVDARAQIEVPLLPEYVVPPDHIRRYPAIPLNLITSFSP
jgi:hypothetical protein